MQPYFQRSLCGAQCRQTLVVATRRVQCRHCVTHLSGRNKVTSASDRRPSAPWDLSSAVKLIRYLHGSYFLPYRSADVLLFCFLFAISIFLLLGSAVHWTLSPPYNELTRPLLLMGYKFVLVHHLQLNLAKTELLVISTNPSLHHNFTFQLGSSTITPSKTVRNLGVVIDDKLNFSDHIAKTARSCRFALFNIKKIRSFLSEHASQLLVQALVLSGLNYRNALLAGLPDSSIKPLQLIQNAAARLIFNESKTMHVTPLFISICTGYK